MNSSRPYGQSVARTANPAGPTIRAGLSVQELKAMTAMRVAQDHNPLIKQNDSAGVFRNPASSYQTATPQQLQAAGIQPLMRNDRNVGHLTREKSATLNSFPIYNSSSAFADQHLVGQNRTYNYDDLNTQHGQHNASPVAGVYRSNTNSSSSNSSSLYHTHGQQQQQQAPSVHRGGVPQINSVEDVKEMTRLRMLMSERESFFEGTANRPVEPPLQGSYDSRYKQRFNEPVGLGALSSDSYDSHDFSVSSARDIRSSTLGYSGSDSNQQQYQHQRYHPTPVSSTAATNKSMLHSASMGGLRPAGTIGQSPHLQPTLPPQQQGYGTSAYGSRPSVPTHMHTHSTASLPVGSSGGVIGTRRIEPAGLVGLHPQHRHSQSLGTQQTGYGAVSPYQQQHGMVNRPADLDSFQLPPHREMGRSVGGGGIERELMLSRQLSGHPNHGLTGGIDRIERSLNGHQHGQLFDHDGLLGQSRFGAQLLGPSRSHHHQQLHSDLSSLNSLLSSPAISPLERRDPLLDVLNRDSCIGGSVPTTARNHGSISPLLGPLSMEPSQLDHAIGEATLQHSIVAPLSLHQRTPSQKIVLDPLELTGTPRSITPREVSPSPAASSLIGQLTPLNVSTEKEKTPTPRQESEGPATTIRKLSFVPKAATFTTVEECRKASSPTSPTVVDQSSLSPTAQDNAGPAVSSPPHRQHPAAVGLSVRVDGIASPDDAPRTQTPSPMNRKVSLIRAHTTSRIPADSGALSPKFLMIKSRLASGESSTPPPSGMDRTMSDSSGGMNFLASEMAEMVLDTPMQAKYFAAHARMWGGDDSREYSNMSAESLHSRDNSSDLSRLLRDMSGMSGCSSNSVSFHE